MSEILYGKPAAELIREDLIKRISTLNEQHGVVPMLSILRVGEKADDLAYEKRLLQMCKSVGIRPEVTALPEDASHEWVLETLKEKNASNRIHGVLVLRPLPPQIDEGEICRAILPKKDIDCMNPENLKGLFIGDDRAIQPCTAEAVIELLKYYSYPLQGKHVVIANRSMVLGKPLSMLFLKENATVTICHSKTEKLGERIREADIFVSGIGKAKYFDGSMFTEHSTVIDVGINFADGKMCGDVDYSSASETAGAITPVPGGVGTVTSAILLRHLVEAAENSIFY